MQACTGTFRTAGGPELHGERRSPQPGALVALAAGQGGLFTAAQAADLGYGAAYLSRAARRGRLERVARAVYRLVGYASYECEEVLVAYLQLGGGRAPARLAVSHETALRVRGCQTLEYRVIHFTLPRAERWRRAPEGVRLHTGGPPLAASALEVIGGMRVTSAARAIVGVIEAGGSFPEVAFLLNQALYRGWCDRPALAREAAKRSERVQRRAREARRTAPIRWRREPTREAPHAGSFRDLPGGDRRWREADILGELVADWSG